MESTTIKAAVEACGADKKKNQNIQVFVRVRPMSNQETAKSAAYVLDTPGSKEVVVRERTIAPVSKTFTFDRVFGAKSKQSDVYKAVVAPLLNEVLLGYNCTVFAYGQTGTGKTYTMEGERSKKVENCMESDPEAGILPRVLSQLFDEVRMMNCEFSVRVSFLELYNEELFDLLAPIEESKTKTLRLFEDSNRKGSVIIQGLEEVIVNNKQEVYSVLDRGSQQRKTAATLMNAHSSRSHTIFTITVHLKECTVDGEEMLKIGKLHLVDLAGSENIGKSGAVQKRAREAGSINMSLLTLGRVITALVERTPHIPYRESKLTRLLQDSLGGKTKTSIIATVSPAACNIEETLSTLDYAHRAKNIMNKPEVNQKLTKKEALGIYTDEIERLRRDLNATREKNGIFMDQTNYDLIKAQIQAQHYELNEKSNKIKEQEELIAEKEKEAEETAKIMEELKQDLALKQTLLNEEKRVHEETKTHLMIATKDGNELKYLVKYHKEKGSTMSEEAKGLLATASDTLKTVDQLHSRLERKKGIEDRNWNSAQRFRGEFRKSVEELIKRVDQLKESHTLSVTHIRDAFDARNSERTAFQNCFVSMLSQFGSTYEESNAVCESRLVHLITTLKALTDAASAEIKGTTEQCHESLSQLVDKLVEGLSIVKNDLTDTQKETAKIRADVTTKFRNLRCSLEGHLTQNAAILENVTASLETIMETYSHCVDQNLTTLSSYKKEQEAYQKECDKKIMDALKSMENLKEIVVSLKKTTKSSYQIGGAALSTVLTSMQSATESNKSVFDTAREQIETGKTGDKRMQAELAGYEKQVVESQSNSLEAVSSKLLEASVERIQTMSDLIAGAGAEHRSAINNINDSLSSRAMEFMAVSTNFADESKADLKKQAEHVTIATEACSTTVHGLCKEEYVHSGKIVETINKQCDTVSDGTNRLNSLLQHQAGNVEEFWEKTYLTDTPSGGTPMRRRYDLPSKLTEASPHSRVMLRYRAVNREIESALSDCEIGGIPDRSWSDSCFNNLPAVEREPERSQTISEEAEHDLSDKENENKSSLTPARTPSSTPKKKRVFFEKIQ